MEASPFFCYVEKEIPYFALPFFEKEGMRAIFSTRKGRVKEGVTENFNVRLLSSQRSEQAERNCALLFQSAELPPFLVVLNQVHSNKVFYLEEAPLKTAGSIFREAGTGDGLITRKRGVCLGVFVADCLPLFFGSGKEGVVGLLHAGWRGLAGGIVEKALELLEEKGHELASFSFVLGPSIRSCCYEVGKEVLQALSSRFSDLPSEKGHIDLAELTREILTTRGVKKERIFQAPYCTSCFKELFFSYRRERTEARQMGVICLLPRDCKL